MVAALGRWAIERARGYGYALGYFARVIKETLLFGRRRQAALRVLVMQILFTGIESLPIVSLMALSIGAVIIVEGGTLLPRFGQTGLLYQILVVVVVRELGPLLTAFIVIARSGTAIATELGNMVVSHEIEAYVSVGIDPIAYLAVPRMLGVTVSMMALTTYFIFFGLFGSFIVSQLLKPIPFIEYARNLLMAFQARDVLSPVVKSFVFGIIVSAVATFQGFKVQVAVTEIPRAVIRAVGQGFVLVFLADALITVVYYV